MKARLGMTHVAIAAALATGVQLPAARAAEPEATARLDAIVEADWAAQEKRRGRSVDDGAAIRDALGRGGRLLGSLRHLPNAPDLREHEQALKRLRTQTAKIDSLGADARSALYGRVRWAVRRLALSNPQVGRRPLVFMKRRRFICQMLHEYLGYFCDYGDIEGGGLFVLKRPGRSLAVTDLVAGRLPRGNYTTPALSYDGKTIYFAFAPRAAAKPDYYSPDRRCFHIHAIGVDGRNLRQLTRGGEDDFDPCPLPDGGIAFMSTRRGGFARCNNPWEPIPSYTMHRMDADGRNVRILSVHETGEWHPSVLNDGRIVYTRWDYVDRSAANFHGLWSTRPDGTGAGIIWGNYTMRINACFQGRAIPGSDRIAFLAGAHHADVGGSLVIVDPSRAALDRRNGQDRFEAIDTLTPELCYPEAAGWPTSYFHSPWPLSEDHFLVAFGGHTLPGMSSGNNSRDHTGLYYFDRFGNLELLYRDEGISCMYPIPLAARRPPPVLVSHRERSLGDEGELILADVTRSHFPLPAGRTVRELRVWQILPKTDGHVANQPRIGHANAENARMLLGTVPVEADGSAYFRVPAHKPVYFQAVDADGRAVQSMRSVVYLQPGERRGCVGCHEPVGTVAPARRLTAMGRGPSPLRAGPAGTMPISFPLLVQPILDRHCLKCHAGKGEAKGRPVLTGEAHRGFSRSYWALRKYVRWYEWGGASISPIVSHPGRIGADASRLTKILAGPRHAKRVRLTDAERRRLYLWLDGNAAFYGRYDAAGRKAQLAGKAAGAPKWQ